MKLYQKIFTAAFISSLSLTSFAAKEAVKAEDSDSLSTKNAIEQAMEVTKRKSDDAFNGWLMAKDNLLSKPRFNYEDMPVPDGKMPTDFLIENLVKESKKMTDSIKTKPSPKIKVFVSLSMPKLAFDSYIKQIAKIGNGNVTFVIRGLLDDNSMPKTVAKIKELTKGKLVFEVDPSSFKRFGVKQVPALVLYEDDPNKNAACAAKGLKPEDVTEEHIGVYGDVTLEYAMEYLIQNHPKYKYIDFLKEQLAKIRPS